MSDNKKGVSLEIITATTMGIVAVACFVIQVFSLNDKTTNTEVALFNTLQFFLTMAFSWFSTRAISKSEFEKSLKKHAVSAYRRISDIDSMVLMLKTEVSEILKSKPSAETADIRVIDALISSTSHIVCSSSDDWADIIGDEILSVEKLKRLERDKEEENKKIRLTGRVAAEEAKLANLEASIEQLKSSLPKSLAREASHSKKEDIKLSMPRAISWLTRKHEHESGLVLRFVAGEGYSDEKDSGKINYTAIKQMTRDKEEEGINLVDEQGAILGRVLNPLPSTYDEASMAIEQTYGGFPIDVEYLGKDEDYEPEMGDFPHHFIKVKSSPKSITRYAKKPNKNVKQTY